MNLFQSRHGGDIFKLSKEEQEGVLDFSININPMGLSPRGKEALSLSWEKEALRYPDTECRALIASLAKRYRMPPQMITVGNGATEIMYVLLQTLNPHKVYVPAPGFSEYRLSAEAVGAVVEEFQLRPEHNFEIPMQFLEDMETNSVIYLGNPNNPDGQTLDERDLDRIISVIEKKRSYLIIDESFIDFLGDSYSYRKYSLLHDRIIIVFSLTKFYAVPGLRIGCSFSSEEITRMCRERLIPWHVNGLAQLYMNYALEDNLYIEKTRTYCNRERSKLVSELSAIKGIKVYSGKVNFILCRLTKVFETAEALQKALWPYKIIIRQCGNYSGLDESYFRIAVRTQEENLQLLSVLRKVFTNDHTVFYSSRTNDLE